MSTATMEETSVKKPVGKKRKRKTHRPSPEEQLKTEQGERYEKLVYMSTKALHKQAKIVRTQEIQKLVRKLKECACEKDKVKVETKLTNLKALNLDLVVRVCQQRLGLPNLNPSKTESSKVEPNNDDLTLVERVLRHKRMVAAMESWNDKVSDHRRWLLRRQEQVFAVPDFVQDDAVPSKGNKKKQKAAVAAKLDAAETTSGLFVTLSGGAVEDNKDDDDDDYHYGPAGADDYASVIKTSKNRKGQRARRAKAMAIQAKREGQPWNYQSINWREPKPTAPGKGDQQQQYDKRRSRNSQDTKPAKVDANEIATMGKEWKQEDKAHPSWAAKQSQKTGIVAFAGKKITFD